MNWRDDARRRVPRRSAEPVAFGTDEFFVAPRSIGTRVRGIPRAVGRTWAGSLQLRVAATTLLVTGVFVFVIGVFLVNQLSSGVLRAKRTAALVQADTARRNAEKQLSGVSATDVTGINLAFPQLTTPTDASGATLYYTSIKTSVPALQSLLGPQPAIPDALRAAVTANGGQQATEYAVVTPPNSTRTVKALLVGQPVNAPSGSFELYYVYPLTSEESTIALVQRTVLFAGLALMILIAGIAVLVTRQVVRPVRVVARSAERMADGDLSQRLVVRGSDEVAQLGRSFNDMAAGLQRQFRRLEDLSRLQRRFTSDVSHELRTPLTTVRMAAEMLHSRRDEFPPDLSRSTELMYDELDRFEGLLADLLEISRYDAGVAALELDTVDVRYIAISVSSAMKHLADTQGSEVEIIAPSEPVRAEVDARRIERILRNLLGNALDHGEGRPIRITIGATEDALVISVRDYGVGLRAGEAGLVFNRFWRGDTSRSRLTGGTGLGLAISLEDARLHGGWLQAWGERGNGALFRLTVPLSAEHVLPAEAPAFEPDPEDRLYVPRPPVRERGGPITGAFPVYRDGAIT